MVCNKHNTPAIIKIAFIQMTERNRNAIYACLNYSQAFTTEEIEERSICIDGDIEDIVNDLKGS